MLREAVPGFGTAPIRRVRHSTGLGAKSTQLLLISRFVIYFPTAHRLSEELIVCSWALISWWRRLVDGRRWLVRWNSMACWRSVGNVERTLRMWFYP